MKSLVAIVLVGTLIRNVPPRTINKAGSTLESDPYLRRPFQCIFALLLRFYFCSVWTWCRFFHFHKWHLAYATHALEKYKSSVSIYVAFIIYNIVKYIKLVSRFHEIFRAYVIRAITILFLTLFSAKSPSWILRDVKLGPTPKTVFARIVLCTFNVFISFVLKWKLTFHVFINIRIFMRYIRCSAIYNEINSLIFQQYLPKLPRINNLEYI